MTVIPLNPTQPAAAADEPAAAGDQPAGGEAYPLPLVMADPARLLLADNVSVDAPGGEHRYFTVTTAADQNKARSTAGTLGWLVDTRGVGGYLIAAGSVCRIDGRRRYCRGTSPPGTPPVPAPRWLLDALTPLAPATTSSEPLGCRTRTPAPPCTPRPTRSAGRRPGPGTTVFHAARRLGQLAAAGLLDDRQITTALTEATAGHIGVDRFTAAEAATAIGNGLRYGHQRPRLIPPQPGAGQHSTADG